MDQRRKPGAVEELQTVQVDNARHETLEFGNPGLKHGTGTEIELTPEGHDLVGAVATDVHIQDGRVKARWTHNGPSSSGAPCHSGKLALLARRPPSDHLQHPSAKREALTGQLEPHHRAPPLGADPHECGRGVDQPEPPPLPSRIRPGGPTPSSNTLVRHSLATGAGAPASKCQLEVEISPVHTKGVPFNLPPPTALTVAARWRRRSRR